MELSGEATAFSRPMRRPNSSTWSLGIVRRQVRVFRFVVLEGADGEGRPFPSRERRHEPTETCVDTHEISLPFTNHEP